MVGVGLFRDGSCGLQNTDGARAYLSSSNYVCNDNNSPSQVQNCNSRCLDSVNSILIYKGVKAVFQDCGFQNEVMPSIEAS